MQDLRETCRRVQVPLHLSPLSIGSNQVVGYDLISVETSEYGLLANLILAGEDCHAYGIDYKKLTVEVTYETKTR